MTYTFQMSEYFQLAENSSKNIFFFKHIYNIFSNAALNRVKLSRERATSPLPDSPLLNILCHMETLLSEYLATGDRKEFEEAFD